MAATPKTNGIVFLISDTSTDEPFVGAVANAMGCDFIHCDSTIEGVKSILGSKKIRAVFLDCSSAVKYSYFQAMLAAESAGKDLGGLSPNLFHLLADEEMSSLPQLTRGANFGNFLNRRLHTEPDKNGLYYARVVKATMETVPPPLMDFLEAGTTVKTIRLKSSAERKKVIEAVHQASAKGGFRARVSDRIAVAVDEILMNAIFDAPIDSSGQRTHLTTPRSKELDLRGRSVVEFQIAFDGSDLGIKISDSFGSLKKHDFLSHVCKPQVDPESIASEHSAGAGLGLASVHAMGCSVFVSCLPGLRTEVSLFFRQAKDVREFKKHFRFLSMHYL